jgi:hypothetical protein
VSDPGLLAALARLVEGESRGDPERALRWTAKSLRNLAAELCAQGDLVSTRSVAPLLRQLGFSLQSNRKSREGSQHPDRDAQFRHINEMVQAALEAGEPVISVDTKKKELGVSTNAEGEAVWKNGSLDAGLYRRWRGRLFGVGWSSVVALQGEAANHRKLLRSRAVVVSVAEKARL